MYLPFRIVKFIVNGIINVNKSFILVLILLFIAHTHNRFSYKFTGVILNKLFTCKDKLFRKAIINTNSHSGFFSAFYFYEFSKLIKTPITAIEKEFAVIIGGLMQTYDKLFDELNLGKSYIGNMLKSYKSFKPNHPIEEATIELYKNLIDRVDQKDHKQFSELIDKMHDAQVDSLLQKNNSDLDVKKMLDITERKGGFNALILVFRLIPKNGKDISNLVYKLGFFAQIVDDINDKEIDKKNNIYTIATHPKTSKKAFNFMKDLSHEIISYFGRLNIERKQKKDYMFKLFVLSTITINFLRVKNRLMINMDRIINKIPVIKIIEISFLIMISILISIREIFEYSYEKYLDLK